MIAVVNDWTKIHTKQGFNNIEISGVFAINILMLGSKIDNYYYHSGLQMNICLGNEKNTYRRLLLF